MALSGMVAPPALDTSAATLSPPAVVRAVNDLDAGLGRVQSRSESAKIAGKTCSKAGAKRTVARVTFLCQKRGKKLVWVRPKAPDTLPKPTTEPTPQVRPSWERVYTDIQNRAASRGSGQVIYDVRYDPAMSATHWQIVAQSLSEAYRPWSEIAPMTNPVPLLIMNESSYEWYMAQDKLFPSNNCGSPWWTRYGSPNSREMTGANCWTRSGQFYFLQRIGSQADTGVNALNNSHESVHVAQNFLLGSSKDTMPCWLGEGQAQIYGAALAKNYSMSDIQLFRGGQIARLPAFIASQGGSSVPVWMQVIQASENRGSSLCLTNYLGYSMGLLMMEKLYEDFGEEQIFNWMRHTRSTGDWKSSFATVFQVDVNSWYASGAAPYLAANVS